MPRKVVKKKNSYPSLIIEVLRKAGKPMHYTDITEEVLPFHPTKAQTPEYSILAALSKNKDIFVRVDKGTYTLIRQPKK
jgi:Uma2 family endonuclease